MVKGIVERERYFVQIKPTKIIAEKDIAAWE